MTVGDSRRLAELTKLESIGGVVNGDSVFGTGRVANAVLEASHQVPVLVLGGFLPLVGDKLLDFDGLCICSHVLLLDDIAEALICFEFVKVRLDRL